MNTVIRLKAEKGRVYINLNTLKYYTCSIYIRPEFEKDWIQINKLDVKQFINEHKAQIINSETPVETTEVKTA